MHRSAGGVKGNGTYPKRGLNFEFGYRLLVNNFKQREVFATGNQVIKALFESQSKDQGNFFC